MSTPPRRSERKNKGVPPLRYRSSSEDSTTVDMNESSPVLNALLEQINALKTSVDQLRNETGTNQAETQRLRETIDRQVEATANVTTQSPLITPPSSYATASGTTVGQSYRKLYDLPQFTGKPEDWPLFLANFEETTANFGYSAIENTIRLQKCLQGEAKDAVASLLIHPNNVANVISSLSFRFGRPDLLIKAQLSKVQSFPAIVDARIEQLIPFSTLIENMVAFMSSGKCEQHLANPMLLEELVLKLPMHRRLDWATFASAITPYATIKDFSRWLSQLARVVQLVPHSTTSTIAKSQPSNTRRMLHTTTTEGEPTVVKNIRKESCICCGASHLVGECGAFKALTVDERWKLVKGKHLCFSCLRIGHGAATCRSRRRCDVNGCRRFHNRMLHEECATVAPLHRVHNCQTQNASSQLFRVLPVVLLGPGGQKSVFAMFDEGSSVSILDEDVATQLGLKGQMENLKLQWFGDKVVTEPSRRVTLEIRGVEKGSQWYDMRNVRTVPNLSLPSQSFDKAHVQHLDSVPFNSYKNARPVLLIGLDNCHLGVASTTIEGNHKDPIVACTKLGWVAYGPQKETNGELPMVFHLKEIDALAKLDQLVNSYFTVENFGVNKGDKVMESEDDKRARRILERSTRQVGEQFETGLLWCSDDVSMPCSYQMAYKRLQNIEAKMRRNPKFAERYTSQIMSYVEKGYARELSKKESKLIGNRTWYLPHFGVVNPHKPEKLRIVFDAAAEVRGISLNSMLLKGPEQAKPLLSILFKFRQGVIGVVADIREMFSQVKIREDDQNSQRFLWRDDSSSLPRVYVMSSMIFGATCSPCAAEYIKNLNAKRFQLESPEAVEAIINNHYVDDYVCSFSNQADAERISMEVKRIHAEGGFVLRNFVCNITGIQQRLNHPICPVKSAVNLEPDKGQEKVLGMYWNVEDDTFRFQLKFHRIAREVLELLRPPTKREMLGIVMAVFDPYGFLADFLIYSKILLQKTWKTGIGWDDPLPQDIFRQWKLWWTGLNTIKQFRLNRCYSQKLQHAEDVELHIFTDASESAFAAVGYFRILYQGEVDVAFVSAKTRCAPKKLLSIPRLELQAAVLGSRLQTTIRETHNIAISRVVYWSDSKTAIWWIRSSHRRYKPFVAHRIAEILDASEPTDWYWLPTDLNVADDATRATNPPKFIMNSRWLTGPDFLRHPQTQWPNCAESEVPETLDEEIRPRILHIDQASNSIICINHFSSFANLRRVMGWILRSRAALSRAKKRIAANQKAKPKTRTSSNQEVIRRNQLTASEIASAERFLCYQTQCEAFDEEMCSLRKGIQVSKTSKIYQLSPHLGQDELLRVSGRIDAAQCLPADARRPIILPQNHAFTDLVVTYYHEFLHHQNDALTINEIRQRYWIPHIRMVLKLIKKECQQCKIDRAKPATPQMGQLPADRLTPYVRPFTYTGLDYFGPLQVAIGRRREKRWVALFTCLTTRAIHLELAGDLSTDALILCLRNFINRRGTPVRIRSDNGTNFIGAKRELAKEAELFDTDHIQKEMSSRGIDWKFSCPLNPSEGGVWERMVQSVKKILRVTLREEAPQVETLRSLLIEAENIINSRPLTELPLTSEEDEPLTPNHFLIGCTNSTQTPNLDELPICRRKQWRIAQQLKNRFWKRWIQEYLPMLTRRSKWFDVVPPLKINDLVIICDASQPRSKWQRGRIVRVYPAKDGQVRSAEVKTSQGTFRRPASKLALMQIRGESPGEFTEGGMSSSK